ncbi:MAG: ATP-binding cassette domain-containing protein [Actinobacteria bacterium]|nr:ATP-binding cassette domain-containing protein [Actinomycetota bacterium]
MTENDYIIEARGLYKYYGAITALENVDFELKRDEVLGLAGDNGAGKSTLIKILSGAVIPNRGTIKVYGREVKINSPRDAFELGIETIYQDLALFDNLDFAQNIFAGREYVGRGLAKLFQFVDNKKMRSEAMNKIKDISINLPNLSQKTEILSGGQRQAVAITRAIFWGRKILIMDEPLAALGVKEATKVLDLIAGVRKNVDGIIVITHNIEHMIKIADRVIVLRTGERAGEIDFKNSKKSLAELHNDVVRLITGAELVVA